MTDKEFDTLKDELYELDPNNDFHSNIGIGVNSGWKKAKHKIAMGSLNKVQNYEEFMKWSNTINDAFYVIMDKLDGISINLQYNAGVLVDAITRGDGIIGESILSNVKQMKNVKHDLYNGFTGSLRGEIILLTEDFNTINDILKKDNAKPMANQRNASSGIAKRENGKFSEFLTILYYDIMNVDRKYLRENEKLNAIEQYGLRTCFYKTVGVEEVIDVYNEYENTKRNELNYEIDGLVIKADNLSLQESMGLLNNRPKAQIAFKFTSAKAIGKVIDVVFTIGNSRRLTPVIHIEPTKIGGVVVRKMTAHNIDFFNKLNLYENCMLNFKRSNDVIPIPLNVVEDNTLDNDKEYFKVPTNCPICNTILINENKYFICPNDNCDGLLIGNLKTWIKKIDIKDIGESIINLLYNTGKVKEPADFYKLEVGDIAGLERLGVKTATKILRHLKEKTSLTIPQLLGSLNITNFSTSRVEMLIEHGYNTLDDIMLGTVNEFIKVKGIEENIATQIVSGLKAKRMVVENLLDVGIKIIEPVKIEVEDGMLSGQSFCFTDAINKTDENGKRYTRNMMSGLVLENGGRTEKSIKKGLCFLVQADPNSVSSKTKKAVNIGVEILSEDSFFEMIDKGE